MPNIKYTHKGWIGLCPVYIANPYSISPDVDTRYPATEWLLHFSLWLFGLVGATLEEDHGMIPIKVTGEIEGDGYA